MSEGKPRYHPVPDGDYAARVTIFAPDFAATPRFRVEIVQQRWTPRPKVRATQVHDSLDAGMRWAIAWTNDRPISHARHPSEQVREARAKGITWREWLRGGC